MVFLLLSIFPMVDGGHYDWEHARFPSTEFLSIRPGERSLLWPESTIPLCYDSDETRDIFHDILWAAMRLWYAAGLPESFRLLEINRLSCIHNPWESVYVEHTRDLLASAIGVPIISMDGTSHYPELSKPTLQVFIDRKNMEWTIKAIAHELGHTFGLLHEHQDQSYWDVHGTDRVFKFNCKNLRDFEEVTGGLTTEEIWGDDGICRDMHTAESYGFSAAEWLPEDGSKAYSSHGWWANSDMVDWESLMIYPSYGDSIDEDKLPVLSRKYDGWTWDSNWSPSIGDVAALKTLYHSLFTNPLLPFWNDVRSPYFAVFRIYSSC
ncbi:hypothetical protein BO94DRAFT_476532 [Aspergillus sclerotioniger CBS 115572]|uniref:Zincin n=1 Tax=Aspergillus sclerotioniger CBS 115572 TaxID=1450535 RepID=A0A317VEQ7_9EURO|nr:hypothetical protein BO94DRAFT_476532 [Aspergillus sclerotioniger CBS 115572]PWY71577.1 hypothetical protein BO94DRAFT_476532 [Aspergillus sclerotioniger CBS 115572]